LDAKHYEVGTLKEPLSESSLENMLMNNGDSISLGARGLAYIALSNEFGPSDQTDLD